MKRERWLHCKLENIMILYFFLLVVICCPYVNANNQEYDLIVELSNTSIESGKNFSVSVYDPQIQNATPYLVNATIVFNNQYYQIFPEDNGEIIIRAPDVDSYKSFIIEAYVNNKMGNASIVVYPSLDTNQLVITTDSYLISANEQFMVIITDQTGNAIENAAVRIQNYDNVALTITDNNGRAFLIAPNQESIDIIAQKQGYLDVIETITIKTIPSQIDQFLSNPQTPIIIAFVILIISIFYVSLLKPFCQKKMKGATKKGLIKKKSSSDLLIDKKRTNFGYNKQHEINPVDTISTPYKMEETKIAPPGKLSNVESINQDKKKQKSSFQWFNSQKTQDQQAMYRHYPLIHNCNQNNQEQDDMHKKIDTLISKKDKKKTFTQ